MHPILLFSCISVRQAGSFAKLSGLFLLESLQDAGVGIGQGHIASNKTASESEFGHFAEAAMLRKLTTVYTIILGPLFSVTDSALTCHAEAPFCPHVDLSLGSQGR